MAVFRVEKTRDYTVMANHHLRNRDLSLKAKGLLTMMLSLPDSWDFTLKGLSCISKEGVDAIREAIRELETAGYIIRNRSRNSNGQLGSSEYVIYEHPQPISGNPTQADAKSPKPLLHKAFGQSPVSGKPILEKPMLDYPIQVNPTQENPTLENPTQLNTNVPITNPLSKNQINIHQSYPDAIDDVRHQIRQQIEYYCFFPEHGKADSQLDEIVELLVDVQCSTATTMQIAEGEYSTDYVKERFSRLTAHHIQYVQGCLKQNTTQIRNIKKYLLTALFNAPITIDHHTQAEVNHYFVGGAER